MNAYTKGTVRAALGGNLSITETDVGFRTEDAMMHVAAAQLKAIAIALMNEEPPDGAGDAWCMKSVLTRGEAAAAIGGVSALLANARSLLCETEDMDVADSAVAPKAEAAE